MNERLKVIQELLEQLKGILDELKEEQETKIRSFDFKSFFDSVRSDLFNGRLQKGQVEGMEAKIEAFKKANFPLSWAAYALATSYHETAKRMLPVREGLNASDTWRKKNLRYYPWYGRGDVQLTWSSNYKRASKELGVDFIGNPDLALDKELSAKIMILGMRDGWFGYDRLGDRHTLVRHLPDKEGTLAQFKQARRIINLMDKADLIADYAIRFQSALKKAGYGE